MKESIKDDKNTRILSIILYSLAVLFFISIVMYYMIYIIAGKNNASEKELLIINIIFGIFIIVFGLFYLLLYIYLGKNGKISYKKKSVLPNQYFIKKRSSNSLRNEIKKIAISNHYEKNPNNDNYKFELDIYSKIKRILFGNQLSIILYTHVNELSKDNYKDMEAHISKYMKEYIKSKNISGMYLIRIISVDKSNDFFDDLYRNTRIYAGQERSVNRAYVGVDLEKNKLVLLKNHEPTTKRLYKRVKKYLDENIK